MSRECFFEGGFLTLEDINDLVIEASTSLHKNIISVRTASYDVPYIAHPGL